MTIASFDIVDRTSPPVFDRPRSADGERDNSFYDMLRQEERTTQSKSEPRSGDRAADRADDGRPRHEPSPAAGRQDVADASRTETNPPAEAQDADRQDTAAPEDRSSPMPATDTADAAETAPATSQPAATPDQVQIQVPTVPTVVVAAEGQASADPTGTAAAVTAVAATDDAAGQTKTPSQQATAAVQPSVAPAVDGRSPAQTVAAQTTPPVPASPVPASSVSASSVSASSGAVDATNADGANDTVADQLLLADMPGEGADHDLHQRRDGRLPSTLESLMKADVTGRTGGTADTTAPQAQAGTAATTAAGNVQATSSATSMVSGQAATPMVAANTGEAVIANGPPTTQPDLAAPSSTPSSVGAVQPAPGNPSAQALATMAAVNRAAQAGPPVHEQVSIRLQKAAGDGIDRFTMQLRPADLGRVDIAMEVGHDGRVQAIVSADRPETLHLLQRDARALEQALQNAGLHTDGGSLSFDLRGGEGQTHDDTESGAGSADPNHLSPSDIDAMPASALTPSELRVSLGGVDLRV
ncbi:MAG: flagellar hook-length control protein FliK [Inquilinaceae bacterium]